MSSSEEETTPVPIKRIKRRKYLCLDNNPIKEVNLFNCKVMPALCNNQMSVLQQMKLKEDSKPKVIPKPDFDLSATSNLSQSDDEDVKVIGEESPIKPNPVTPPPERVLGGYTNDKKFERKKMKLLQNVASVLQRTKEDKLSIAYTPERSDHDVTNDCVIVKVRFHSSIYKYAVKRGLDFGDIFQRLAKVGKTKKENLLLTVNDRRIYPEDTPENIGLTVVDFVDAVVMDEQILKQTTQDETNKHNFINVHFQSKLLKQKQTYYVNKFEPFSETMSKYAKLIDLKIKDLCFLFDGEKINGTLTPIQLEIEDDYCIDVAKVNKK